MLNLLLLPRSSIYRSPLTWGYSPIVRHSWNQGNSRRLFDNRWDNNTFRGKLSRLGLTPILWFTIFLMIGTYMHSVVIASNLPRFTAGFGLFAWTGVFLATIGLVLFYRCSRWY